MSFVLTGVYDIFFGFRLLELWDSHKVPGDSTHLKSVCIGIQLRCGQREKNLVHREVKPM